MDQLIFTILSSAHILVGLHDMRGAVADACELVEDMWEVGRGAAVGWVIFWGIG
jgi:hypothetical protein